MVVVFNACLSFHVISIPLREIDVMLNYITIIIAMKDMYAVLDTSITT